MWDDGRREADRTAAGHPPYRWQLSIAFKKYNYKCDSQTQCENWPKRTGRGVRCRNVWNFAKGLKFKADFHSKMSVCRHELGGGEFNSHPQQFSPAQTGGVWWHPYPTSPPTILWQLAPFETSAVMNVCQCYCYWTHSFRKFSMET